MGTREHTLLKWVCLVVLSHEQWVRCASHIFPAHVNMYNYAHKHAWCVPLKSPWAPHSGKEWSWSSPFSRRPIVTSRKVVAASPLLPLSLAPSSSPLQTADWSWVAHSHRARAIRLVQCWTFNPRLTNQSPFLWDFFFLHTGIGDRSQSFSATWW